MACPECGGSLTAERVEGIEIDRCSHCVGVWLDAGEYDAVRRHIEHPLEYPHSHATGRQESDSSTESKTDGVLSYGFDLILMLGELFF